MARPNKRRRLKVAEDDAARGISNDDTVRNDVEAGRQPPGRGDHLLDLLIRPLNGELQTIGPRRRAPRPDPNRDECDRNHSGDDRHDLHCRQCSGTEEERPSSVEGTPGYSGGPPVTM